MYPNKIVQRKVENVMINKRKYLAAVGMIILTAVIVMACKTESADTKIINIVRYPEPADYTSIFNSNKFPEEKDENFEFDVRSTNLSSENLSDRLDDLLYTTYDSKTIWPEKLPEGFNPEEIMEIYKNPGLGMRELHKQGITGKGVGIAIIDQTLLVDHVEYKDRIKLYEENENAGKHDAQMHGPAVASIAVGKTVGVAPEADLYYIAGDFGTFRGDSFEDDFSLLAKNIERILEVNKELPEADKIRVISISKGWSKGEKGYEEITEAVNKAKEEGIFVISTSLEETYGYSFHGLGKYPMSDADALESYKPGSWWEEYAEMTFKDKFFGEGPFLLAPMDFRCTAAPNGVNDYVVYSSGGWSWTVPYIAGVYSLACQVNPDITYDEFWEIALETGKEIMLKTKGGQEYAMEKIINPAGIIERLK